MNPFIHTFSIIVNIKTEELNILQNSYRWIDLKKSYKGIYYDYSITEFCDNGLQMQIRRRTDKEIQFDKEHCPYQAELVVTPYKLLHPGKSMGEIASLDEMGKALNALEELLEQIKNDTGIDFISNRDATQKYKIQRVDITCDVETPSDAYSNEIIAASKVAKLPYGYARAEATEEELKNYDWRRENASLFYNKNQHVLIKIYNKKENLKGKEEYQDYLDKGLVRYEISMLRQNLKKYGHLLKDKLGACLRQVMNFAKELFNKYFINNLWDLSMFSWKVLQKYLEKHMKGKEKTLEKMFHFSKTAYKCKRAGTVLTAKECGMSEEQFTKCYWKFNELGISPIPAEEGCPYIPSIENMLDGQIEPKLAVFAKKKTRKKEIWGYEQR